MNLSISPEDLKAFWIAFIVSAILSKPILNLLIKAKSRQTVSSHLEGHATKQGTPTMGGIIILVGIFAALAYLGLEWGFDLVVPVGLLVGLFGLIGYVDDYVVPRMMPGKRGLGWKQKILMQVVAAVVPFLAFNFLAAPNVGFVDGLKLYSVSDIAIAAFFILFFANAFNFADGLDALASTLLLGLLVGMIGIPAMFGGWFGDTPVLWATFGGTLVFLYWNAPRARVFMGDVGSLPIGALIGGYWFFQKWMDADGSGVAPFMHRFSSPESALVLPVLIWSIPMICELVPVPLQVFSVKVFKKKLFPFTPIHHAFEEIKLKPGETTESESYIERVRTSPRWAHWPETRIVFTFAIFQLLCSMLAITVAYFSVNK